MSLSLLAIVFSSEVVDAVRTNLEVESAFWFGLVKYSGYAVAFGCALESPETFIVIKNANEGAAKIIAGVLTAEGIDATAAYSLPEVREPSATLVIEVGRKPEKEARDAVRELGPFSVPSPFTSPGGPGVVSVKGSSIGTIRLGIDSIPLEPNTGKQ